MTQIYLYIPDSWLWHSMHALPATILHPGVMCWIVSGTSLHSLHLGSWLVWYTMASMDLVLAACSCAAMICASVLSFSTALSSHWLDFLIIDTSSICRWYILYGGLSFHDGSPSCSSSFSCFWCLKCLLSTWSFVGTFLMYRVGCSSEARVPTNWILGCLIPGCSRLHTKYSCARY